MNRIATATAFVPLFAVCAIAQQDVRGADRARALAEAARLGDMGDISTARRMTDSLAKTTPPDDPDFGEVLLARARYAPSVLDASLDYERIVSELPRSPAAKASLLRLAQRALISSDAAKALDYLQRILRDFPDDASVAETQYWRAVVLLDAHDSAAACSANHEALTHAQAAHLQLAGTIESRGFAPCGGAAAVRVLTQPSAVTAPQKTTSGRKVFSVQVAAFETRRDADAMAARLAQRGLDAHVDGDSNPFRVRIGHYETYADAARAMRDLKAKKIAGFIAGSNE